MLPGNGCHSSTVLMYASESALITPSRSSITSFGVASDILQQRDVRDAQEQLTQRVQQSQAVLTQCGVLGVYHYLVEEGINFGLQSCHCCQRFGVAMRGKQRVYSRKQFIQCV